MGKIFGISDNPVSTIESALKPLELKVEPSNIYPVKYLNRDTDKTDKFISKEKQNKPAVALTRPRCAGSASCAQRRGCADSAQRGRAQRGHAQHGPARQHSKTGADEITN